MITNPVYVFILVVLTQLHRTHAISLVPTKCVRFFITSRLMVMKTKKGEKLTECWDT
jgi:hypothetical protein